MPSCFVCDGEEFELTNGLYFCKICSTQSQEIVEQGYDNVAELQVGRIIKVKQKKRKDKQIHRGKPWYTVEAYQVILKAQVEALIKLGITPQLKDVVKQIWFKYLQISGNAIINNSTSEAKTNNLLSFRDEYLCGVFGSKCVNTSSFPTIKNSINLKVPKRRKLISSSEEGEEKTHSKQRNVKKREEKPWRSDEEWFTFGSDSGSDEEEEEKEEETKTPKKQKETPIRYSRIDRRIHRRERWEVKQKRIKMEYITINKLIAILQVALRWCQEYVDTGDIILWIQQGYIPYIDCLKYLLPHMKLTNFDSNIQNKPIPTYKKMSYLHEEMTKYVEMPNMPKPNLLHLVAKYILRLNLPRGLVCFVNKVISVSKFVNDRKDCSIPEVVAISLIIISMKLLFGLDENREWMNDFSVEICYDSECDPFKWSEWVGYHLQRREVDQSSPINTFYMKDVEKVDDIFAYVEHWYNLLINSTLACKEEGGTKASTKFKKETLQTRTWAFMKMTGSEVDELDHCKAVREYPYVAPSPPLHLNMGKKCISYLVHSLGNDPNYIRYTDEFLRSENFSKKFSSSNSNLTNGEAQLRFHKTYAFLLILTAEITCASISLIHRSVQRIETRIFGSFLEARDEQKYLYTDFDALHC